MNGLQVKTVADPDIVDVLHNLKLDIFSSLNCVKIGSIKSFNGTKKTAQVQILFKRTMNDGSIQSQPVLVDVPVFTLQGGGSFLQMPIAVGDQCLILFCDRRLDEWFANGAEAAPGDPRMHDLSDGIALVGVNALNSSLPAYPASSIKIAASGSAEIDLDTLVAIKNGTTSLLTALSNLISTLQSLTVTVSGGTGVVSAATIAALNTVQGTLNSLLR